MGGESRSTSGGDCTPKSIQKFRYITTQVMLLNWTDMSPTL